MKRHLGSTFILTLALGAGLLVPTGARAVSSYYASECAGCHGTTPTTCNGCHHHRGTPAGSLAKTAFAPGEAMAIGVTAGQRTGWWRAAVLDGSNNVLGTATATASGVATVTVTAPSAAGSYAWKVAWYGNQFGETPAPAAWVPDAGNGDHGYLTAALPAFTVEAAPVPAPVATLAPAALALGSVATGQTASLAATVGNSGSADLVVGAPTPCDAGNAASLTLTPLTGFTVAAGGSATLSVTFAPSAAGAAAACWNLTTNDPGHPTLQLTASGTGADSPPPPPPPASCTGCHAIPPASGEHAAHAGEGCGACHGAGYSSTTVVAGTHANGAVDLASSAGWSGATTSCANACHGSRSWGTAPPPPTQSCTTCHGAPPSTGRHATHAGESCGACHGAGYTSTAVAAGTHQDGKPTIAAGAGWNATARSCANSCHGAESWGGSATASCTSCHSTPPTSGRHTLHRSEHVSCAACHGSGYSTTTVNATSHDDGAVTLTTAVRWDPARRSCSNSCHDRESWGGGTAPPPSAGCTGCHRIPPASGEHAEHQSERVACGTCHGTGYSTTTVNGTTHRDGKVNLSRRIGFNASRRTCSNSCHGTERWLASTGGGDDHEEDDFVIGADDPGGAQEAGSGCSTAGSSLPLLGLLAITLLGLRRRRTSSPRTAVP